MVCELTSEPIATKLLNLESTSAAASSAICFKFHLISTKMIALYMVLREVQETFWYIGSLRFYYI